jgi:hypothetical protein
LSIARSASLCSDSASRIGPRCAPPTPRSSDDKILVDGTKAALDKLQARKRAAENRIELKRQIGLKILRTPSTTLTIAEASLNAIAVAPEDIPACWWKPQPPKPIKTGSPKRSAPARKRSGSRGNHEPGGTQSGVG